jgi:hypothetical protein
MLSPVWVLAWSAGVFMVWHDMGRQFCAVPLLVYNAGTCKSPKLELRAAELSDLPGQKNHKRHRHCLICTAQ